MLARFSTASGEGSPRFGFVQGDEVTDLTDAFPDWPAFLEHFTDSADIPSSADAKTLKLADVKLLAPVESANKILCVAQNYKAHVEENNAVAPSSPIFFHKTPESIIAQGDDIHLPGYTEFLDYEAEIAVVVGKTMKNVAPENVLDYVAGFTALNDTSARDLLRVPAGERTHLDWFSCKCVDHSSPVGPTITLRKDFGDFDTTRVQTRLNGKVMQDSTPEDMVVPLLPLLSFLSGRSTLSPGDLIATGTPGGVGVAQGVNLKDGDEVEIVIDNIPVLKNRVRAVGS
jgi:acylpyruvate hydrolase